jgi:hypothetical protein
MENKMKRMLLVMVVLSMIACTGKQGPMGPAGPGNRTVYTSTTPIPYDDLYTVSIPEITTADMPLVSTYVRLDGNTLWTELPMYFENLPDFGQGCFYSEGHVSFTQCQGFYYKIVVIK